MTVDVATGRIIDSTASGSKYEKQLTKENMNAISKDPNRNQAYLKIIDTNENMSIEEKQVIGFGKKTAPDKDSITTYSYKKVVIKVDETGNIVDSTAPGSKYRKVKDLTSSDVLTREQYDTAKNFIDQAGRKLLSNNRTLGHTLDATWPDTIARNKQINNFEQSTRSTMQEMYNRLQGTGMVRDAVEAINPLRAIGKIGDAASKGADVFKDYTSDTFAEDLIAAQLKNSLGSDSMSGESLFKFDDATQKELIDAMKQDQEYAKLFDKSSPLTPLAKMQLIARMTDIVMNKIGEPDIASFKTEYDAQGDYTSTISSKDPSKPSLSSTINNDGKTISRTFSFVQQDGKNVLCSTFIDSQTGKSMTKMKITQPDGSFDSHELTPDEAKIAEQSTLAYKAKVFFKCSMKATLWWGKQVAINVVGMKVPIPMADQTIAGVVVTAVIKPVSMLLGYKFTDPTVRATLSTMVEVSCGDRRAILSADPTRVFSRGTIASKMLSGDWKEQKDQTEEYYTLINDAVDIALIPARKMLPTIVGNRLLSKTDLVKGSAVQS
jgi:hypothetical protein